MPGGGEEIGDAVAHQAGAENRDRRRAHRRSPRRIAAVDIHDLPGAEVGRRREQIDRHADQVLDLAQPAERNARERARARRLAELVVAYIQAVSLERNTVGAIAFTVMPCFAHSVASTRVSASVAPLEVQ